ncbi:MAG: hypothetical protein AABX30_02945 [Nanoarchaeota archaeon]|mgnify:CR=1 FL=1
MVSEHLIYFFVSVIFLALSGVFLAKSLSKIAKHFGISEFAAAFLIMGFATSLPEIFVGISSSIQGKSVLGIGNIFGSNMIDLILALGIFVILAKGIKIKDKREDKDVHYMIIGMILILILFLIGNSLSRIDGIILIIFFVVSTIFLFKRKKKNKKLKIKTLERKRFISAVIIFIISLAVLLIASFYTVKYASLIAVDFEISDIILGLFLISFATSLPEIIFGIDAILLKKEIMSLGDQTGGVFIKMTFLLGIMALISPIILPAKTFLIPLVPLILGAFIFSYFLKSDRYLSVKEGVYLILFYLFFLIIQFLF